MCVYCELSAKIEAAFHLYLTATSPFLSGTKKLLWKGGL